MASLPPGTVFPPSGRQLITLYLIPTATRGELSNAKIPGGCSVTAGVDVFAVSPNKLPFESNHTRPHEEVWGYFAAAHMADGIQPAPGGCWVLYGKEKGYVLRSQTVGYRRRFAFRVTRVERDGTVMWAPTRWMMKEYRLNKDAEMLRKRKLEFPEANMDFVIRKFFTKPVIPQALQGAGVRLASREAQPTKVPVKASAVAVPKDSTRTKTKTKTKKVVPPPIPPYARSEGGVALQQGGTSLPPRSARPPLPPRFIKKPVPPPPSAHVIATPVAPPNPAQVIAKPVAPPPPPPKVIATPVTPRPQPQAIATPVTPPPPPQVIATPVAPSPPPARSSQDEAALSRAQPDNPNTNRELVVYRGPAKPLAIAPPRLPPPGRIAAGRTFKVPSGRWIIGQYLGPKAVGDRQISSGVNPGVVAEGVDVFAVSPHSLPSPPMHRKQNGQVLGYFFAAKPTTSMRVAPGGCWMQYGREKKYAIRNGEVIAFHRRFAFHASRVDGNGKVASWERSQWLMKEYRMNKDTPSARKVQKGPGANMDLVVFKVFTKPVVPPLPPPPPEAPTSFSESVRLCSNFRSNYPYPA